MITVPTTLVLGAGASKPYEFPTGRKLTEWLHNPNNLRQLEDIHSITERDIKEFCSAFHLSQMPSIDAFLARRAKHSWCAGGPEFGNIGKLAISLMLSKCESRERPFLSQADHWYRYLWNCIGESLDGFAENKLRIITFNYDRSLEYYLLTTLQHSFGIHAEKAAGYLRKLPILHVYGQLGELPELAENRNDICVYRNDSVTTARIATAAKSIRVIDEHRDDDDVFAKAYEWLSESKRICFIGFGFDSTNVRRLKLRELRAISSDQRFNDVTGYATTYGMENAERGAVISLLTRGRPINNNVDVTQKNIAPYGDFEPERYLRATGVLNAPAV